MRPKYVVAENVEVDIEALRIAKDITHELLHKRLEAAEKVVDAVINALADKETVAIYLNGGNNI